MRPYWIAAAVFIFLIMPGAKAIDPPDVSFIPTQISANSGFLLIVDPHAVQSEKPVTVSWSAPGFESNYTTYGTLESTPYSKWIWYFSNVDPESNGPNIFTQSTASYGVPYTLIIRAENKNGQNETTILNLTIGGIAIGNDVYVSGKNVIISAWPYQNTVNSISYEIYNDAFDKMKTGGMVFKGDTGKFYVNVTLENGEYYIAFKGTNTGTGDFGGGLTRVTVGGGPGPVTTGVAVEPIIYKTTIRAGDTFTLKRFRITNTGTENLTDLTIIVDQQTLSVCNCQINITPEKTSLLPNESTIMDLALTGIKSPTNLSFSATLQSGSNDIYHIPVNLDIGVVQGTCSGKEKDGTDCLGGICCDDQCRTDRPVCCTASDCSTGQVCTNYKCVPSTPVNECEGKGESASCSSGNGKCCSWECKIGDCCSSSDCFGLDETCVLNKCKPAEPTTCSNDTQCSPGKCCTESCVTGNECCNDNECTGKKTCQDGSCVTKPSSGCTTDSDCTVAGEVCQSGSCVTPSGGLDMITIAMVGGGVAIAAAVGFLLLKKFRKKGSGDEELGGEDKEEGEEELSDEDFY